VTLAQLESAGSLVSTPDHGGRTMTEIPAGQGVMVRGETVPGWLRVEAPVANSIEYVFGWLASQANGGPALTPLAANGANCPPLSTGLGFFHPEVQRSCAGEETLELEGQITALPITNRLFVGDPAWLAQVPGVAIAGLGEMRGAIPIHLTPDLAASVSLGDLVRMTGHFNDQRAATCRREPADPSLSQEPEAEQQLWCSQRFVVDSVKPLDG
jgi:hypothetical protein